jgi:hypothetical protein
MNNHNQTLLDQAESFKLKTESLVPLNESMLKGGVFVNCGGKPNERVSSIPEKMSKLVPLTAEMLNGPMAMDAQHG